MRFSIAGLAGMALAGLAGHANASCGSAFCLVNTDWSVQGAWTEPGVRADLRFESIDLDQPMNGRDRVSVGQVSRHHDEVETRNKNWLATIDWTLAPQWGISVVLPYVDRQHTHIHNHHGAQLLEQWDFRNLGDVRVTTRYEFLQSNADPARVSQAGITFGVKLPTGKYDVTNGDGEEAERTLQPGSGTTDLLVGLHWYAGLPLEDWSWFAQVQGVIPTNERAGFKPGKQLRLDGGIRKGLGRDVSAMLQVNYVAKGRDSGSEAEPEDSGQRLLFASPGVSWNISRSTQVYGFVQLPLYQSVNGVQLTARRSFVAGVSSRF